MSPRNEWVYENVMTELITGITHVACAAVKYPSKISVMTVFRVTLFKGSDYVLEI